MTIEPGAIVRYKPEFYNWYHNGRADVEDCYGEVVSMSRLVAVVRWDNNTESRVLISNLEIAKGTLIGTYNPTHLAKLNMIRPLLIAGAWVKKVTGE